MCGLYVFTFVKPPAAGAGAAYMACERDTDTETTTARISMKFGRNVLWYMLLN
jgi:hypothetical protein